MWIRFLTVRETHRLERALDGATDPAVRQDLTEQLAWERLKLLGPNAAAVDPARLFHGASRTSDDDGCGRRLN
jgi:hypothetical protein